MERRLKIPPQYIAEETEENELDEAVKILKGLRKAYKDHILGRAFTKSYKIKDREMEFNSLADMQKAIKFWEREVYRLEAAAGIVSPRPRQIKTRFA